MSKTEKNHYQAFCSRSKIIKRMGKKLKVKFCTVQMRNFCIFYIACIALQLAIYLLYNNTALSTKKTGASDPSPHPLAKQGQLKLALPNLPLSETKLKPVHMLFRSVDLKKNLSSRNFSPKNDARICFSILTTRKYLKLEIEIQVGRSYSSTILFRDLLHC